MLLSSSPLSFATLRRRRIAERALPARAEPPSPIVRSLAFGSISSAENAAVEEVIAEELMPPLVPELAGLYVVEDPELDHAVRNPRLSGMKLVHGLFSC
jgi:hypothetical protein